MLSHTEENHIKAVYHLSMDGTQTVSTNELATRMNTAPASVTDMLKRLSAKNLVEYERYHGVRMTGEGNKAALRIIRRHRLWETFLVHTLGFKWDEVHDVAEQLEHVQSAMLEDKLDDFLGRPSIDPHGHTIPDREGRIPENNLSALGNAPLNCPLQVGCIGDGDPKLLQYLSGIGVYLGATLTILDRRTFDGSMQIRIDDLAPVDISREVGSQILIHG